MDGVCGSLFFGYFGFSLFFSSFFCLRICTRSRGEVVSCTYSSPFFLSLSLPFLAKKKKRRRVAVKRFRYTTRCGWRGYSCQSGIQLSLDRRAERGWGYAFRTAQLIQWRGKIAFESDGRRDRSSAVAHLPLLLSHCRTPPLP